VAVLQQSKELIQKQLDEWRSLETVLNTAKTTESET
jgi:hypothetical protein